jgi:hypothetical protein
MNMSTSPSLPWCTSSFSVQGNCVEVRLRDSDVQIRNTRDREGPVLSFTHAEWTAFLSGANNHEFDLVNHTVPAGKDDGRR